MSADLFAATLAETIALHERVSRDPQPVFFVTARRGPQTQPKKSAARDAIINLRKQNYSVYEISETLRERGLTLSPTGVREVLKAEGFAALPRRLDEERPDYPRPTIEAVADVRALSWTPRRFTTRCGGLFLFVPDLVHRHVDTIATAAPITAVSWRGWGLTSSRAPRASAAAASSTVRQS